MSLNKEFQYHRQKVPVPLTKEYQTNEYLVGVSKTMYTMYTLSHTHANTHTHTQAVDRYR